MPLQATSGAASYDAFGGGVPVVPAYIEQIFSTYLYTGNSTSQTITNEVDLAGKGGLVWIKRRNGVGDHTLTDTIRGPGKEIYTNQTWEQQDYTGTYGISAFNSTGFSLIGNNAPTNSSGQTYCSWTFRKQPKFFDVVTYTGTGAGYNIISHNLGSTPGCIIIKRTDSTSDWFVWHRKDGSANSVNGLSLNLTDAAVFPNFGMSTYVNSSTFAAGLIYSANTGLANVAGATYVAYLFAHNAGGFGLTGTDNVISCGSFTTDGSGNATISLGYEPQWVLIKRSDASENWYVIDNMRGWPAYAQDQKVLFPNLSAAEISNGGFYPTATGFQSIAFTASATYIYIAIRRGPMKVPTVGTSVFSPNARTGNGSTQTVSGLSFSPDLWMTKNRGNTQNNWSFDRLRGPNQPLSSNLTDDEATNTSNYFGGTPIFTPTNTGFTTIGQAQVNTNTGSYIDWLFGRAPSFMDVVCYTGTGSATNFSHNLGVVPEMMIIKNRTSGLGESWNVYHAALGNTSRVWLELNSAVQTGVTAVWNSTTPTASVFTVGTNNQVNLNGSGIVNYLFATCAGVSKVFSYTGNGSSQTINCGFTGGARWILIKRTDSTGDWYVWDSARGIVAGNDPHLSLNSTAAEVTSDDTIDTDSTGFVVNQLSATNVNVSSATYIGLAIA